MVLKHNFYKLFNTFCFQNCNVGERTRNCQNINNPHCILNFLS